MWSSTWATKTFSVTPNVLQPYEYYDADKLDLCYYKIIASSDLDKFSVLVGHSSSRVQYTLLVKTFTGELRKLDTSYDGTINAISKNHKEFYLLALPMGEVSTVKFSIQSGDKSINSSSDRLTFFTFLILFLILWIFAIIGILAYWFLFKNNKNYMKQQDDDITEDNESEPKASARDVPRELFSAKGGFCKILIFINLATQASRIRFSQSKKEFKSLKDRIKHTILKEDDSDNFDSSTTKLREKQADLISKNCARALFNFLRSTDIDDQKSKKLYDPILFLPWNTTFFDESTTYYSKIMNDNTYKNHGIHRAKSYLKQIFKDEKVVDQIDSAFNKYDTEYETDHIIMEFAEIALNVISIAMVFDIISTLGYEIDKVFITELDKIANGDYKFVIEQAAVFINNLEEIVSRNGEKYNKEGFSVISITDVAQLKDVQSNDYLLWITYLQSCLGEKANNDKDELLITVPEMSERALKISRISRKINTKYDNEVFILAYTEYQKLTNSKGDIYLKIM